MSKKTRASLFAGIYVISSLFWGPWAEAAFHLERADDSQPTKGLNIPATLLLADVHWPVYQSPPKPRPVKVQAATYRPTGAAGRCYTEPGTPPQSVLNREVGGVGYKSNRYNGGATYKLPGHSSASGCWQFVRGTWGGYKGFANAADAPVHIQNERAKQIWAGGAGCKHWSAC